MTNRRRFRVESAERGWLDGKALEGSAVAVHLDKILAELSSLRLSVAKLDQTESEGKALWGGVDAIQQAIQHTRREISALHKEGGSVRLNRATDELDAVVTDTEGATEAILSSAESIDSVAATLMKRLKGEERELVETIQGDVVRIFESCNFQDITGQRISKVVNLLHFVESRVETMLEIWGSINDADVGLESAREGDAALLNGPALSGDVDVVSQADIDSLFA